MSEKPRSFVLQPSRLGKQVVEGEDKSAATRPNFTGLKESKLGMLAESKLTPSTGAIQAKPVVEEPSKPPPTFSFTPLTRPVDDNKPVEGENKVPTTTTATKEDNNVKENKEKGFVFGQNLNERVENVSDEGCAEEPATGLVFGEGLAKKVSDSSNDSKAVSNTTSSPSKDFSSSSPNLLFGGVVSPSSGAEDDGSTKTLSENAAEYTENHSNKRKYDVVDVVTGEEEESNVLQANVKMYLFDSEKRNWTERGRGVLRLNDDPVSTPGHLKSRLVMRTVGSLRVVLNTKLWPNMICEKANEKNVRISAMEENEVKIFLIACSPKDADKLFTALEYRISQLKADSCDSDNGPPPEKKVAKDV